MKNFILKNGPVAFIVTGIGSLLAVTGAYVATLIKGEKREIRRYKQIDEEHEAIMENLRGTKKES